MWNSSNKFEKFEAKTNILNWFEMMKKIMEKFEREIRWEKAVEDGIFKLFWWNSNVIKLYRFLLFRK